MKSESNKIHPSSTGTNLSQFLSLTTLEDFGSNELLVSPPKNVLSAFIRFRNQTHTHNIATCRKAPVVFFLSVFCSPTRLGHPDSGPGFPPFGTWTLAVSRTPGRACTRRGQMARRESRGVTFSHHPWSSNGGEVEFNHSSRSVD